MYEFDVFEMFLLNLYIFVVFVVYIIFCSIGCCFVGIGGKAGKNRDRKCSIGVRNADSVNGRRTVMRKEAKPKEN